jgi:hypothetical protein
MHIAYKGIKCCTYRYTLQASLLYYLVITMCVLYFVHSTHVLHTKYERHILYVYIIVLASKILTTLFLICTICNCLCKPTLCAYHNVHSVYTANKGLMSYVYSAVQASPLNQFLLNVPNASLHTKEELYTYYVSLYIYYTTFLYMCTMCTLHTTELTVCSTRRT